MERQFLRCRLSPDGDSERLDLTTADYELRVLAGRGLGRLI